MRVRWLFVLASLPARTAHRLPANHPCHFAHSSCMLRRHTALRAIMPPDGKDTVYEVTIPKPLGLQFAESPGKGVVVSVVFDGGNAAQQGVQAGDMVTATSASIGSQMCAASSARRGKTGGKRMIRGGARSGGQRRRWRACSQRSRREWMARCQPACMRWQSLGGLGLLCPWS